MRDPNELYLNVSCVCVALSAKGKVNRRLNIATINLQIK